MASHGLWVRPEMSRGDRCGTESDLKKLNQQTAELDILQECLDLLLAELKKVMQRVNLFEKVMIPNTLENIRRIRIALGDQMTRCRSG